MSEREARIARNESISRRVNEDLEPAHEAKTRSDDSYVRMVCECGDPGCERLIAITIAEYERVRSRPERFAVLPEHVIPDVEVVVERTDRFVIVSKREGTPRDVAEAEDPRS